MGFEISDKLDESTRKLFEQLSEITDRLDITTEELSHHFIKALEITIGSHLQAVGEAENALKYYNRSGSYPVEHFLTEKPHVRKIRRPKFTSEAIQIPLDEKYINDIKHVPRININLKRGKEEISTGNSQHIISAFLGAYTASLGPIISHVVYPHNNPSSWGKDPIKITDVLQEHAKGERNFINSQLSVRLKGLTAKFPTASEYFTYGIKNAVLTLAKERDMLNDISIQKQLNASTQIIKQFLPRESAEVFELDTLWKHYGHKPTAATANRVTSRIEKAISALHGRSDLTEKSFEEEVTNIGRLIEKIEKSGANYSTVFEDFEDWLELQIQRVANLKIFFTQNGHTNTESAEKGEASRYKTTYLYTFADGSIAQKYLEKPFKSVPENHAPMLTRLWLDEIAPFLSTGMLNVGTKEQKQLGDALFADSVIALTLQANQPADRWLNKKPNSGERKLLRELEKSPQKATERYRTALKDFVIHETQNHESSKTLEAIRNAPSLIIAISGNRELINQFQTAQENLILKINNIVGDGAKKLFAKRYQNEKATIINKALEEMGLLETVLKQDVVERDEETKNKEKEEELGEVIQDEPVSSEPENGDEILETATSEEQEGAQGTSEDLEETDIVDEEPEVIIETPTESAPQAADNLQEDVEPIVTKSSRFDDEDFQALLKPMIDKAEDIAFEAHEAGYTQVHTYIKFIEPGRDAMHIVFADNEGNRTTESINFNTGHLGDMVALKIGVQTYLLSVGWFEPTRHINNNGRRSVYLDHVMPYYAGKEDKTSMKLTGGSGFYTLELTSYDRHEDIPVEVSLPLHLIFTPENHDEAKARQTTIMKYLQKNIRAEHWVTKRDVLEHLEEEVAEKKGVWHTTESQPVLGHGEQKIILFPKNGTQKTTLSPGGLVYDPGDPNPSWKVDFSIRVNTDANSKHAGQEVRHRQMRLHTTDLNVAQARGRAAMWQIEYLLTEYAQKHPDAIWSLQESGRMVKGNKTSGHDIDEKTMQELLDSMMRYAEDVSIKQVGHDAEEGLTLITLQVFKGKNSQAINGKITERNSITGQERVIIDFKKYNAPLLSKIPDNFQEPAYIWNKTKSDKVPVQITLATSQQITVGVLKKFVSKVSAEFGFEVGEHYNDISYNLSNDGPDKKKRVPIYDPRTILKPFVRAVQTELPMLGAADIELEKLWEVEPAKANKKSTHVDKVGKTAPIKKQDLSVDPKNPALKRGDMGRSKTEQDK